jgi:uncharacterized peroxidase-related enzyme
MTTTTTNRLPLVQPETATGKAKDLLGAVQKGLGMVPNMAKAMANAPAVLQGYLQFSGALAAGSLPARSKEQIALLTAQRNECGYCLSAHTALGKKAGLSDEEVGASRRGEAVDVREAAILAFARSVIDNRGGVADFDLKAARTAGLDDQAIAEIVGHVALNTLTNYFNRAAETEIDFPKVVV